MPALVLGYVFAGCAFLKEATTYHAPDVPATYQPKDSDVLNIATVKMSGQKSKERVILAFIERVDDLPLKTRGVFFGAPNVGIPDEVVKISPGERKLLVRVLFVKTGLKNALLLRTGLFGAGMQVNARVESGKEYLVKGDIREKSCVAWLEDSVNGTKITSELLAPCEEYGHGNSTGGAIAGAVAGSFLEALFR